MAEVWWRSWHGAPMDHKWSVIAGRANVKTGVVSAIAWALFDHASQQTDRGCVSTFDVETYSVFSGFTEDEINAVIQAMTDKGIIVDGRLTAWDKRQPKSESEINRVKAWREKKAAQNVTPGYEPLPADTHETDEATALTYDNASTWLEQVTGLSQAGKAAVKAMDDLLEFSPTVGDLRAAYDWLNSQGKQIRYWGQLVGPTRTATARRVNPPTNGKPPIRTAKDLGYTAA